MLQTELSTLVTNLRLIRARYPSVHRRLDQKVISGVLDGLYRCEDGRFAYLVEDERKHRILIKESGRKVEVGGKRMVILLGIGLGYQLFDIFRRLERDQLLVAVETRPDLLCKSLYVHDWSELLGAENFRLFLGHDQHQLSELAERIGQAPEREELALLDNKVLVTIDQRPYSWWNLYFYLISGLPLDGIRVINAVMGGFNLWDPDNLFLNMPSEFLGKKVSELEPDQIYSRFRTLARVLAPGLQTIRSGALPCLKAPDNDSARGRVSVVVLCWNKCDHTRHCLESLLARTDYPELRVIAVDNGSTDGTAVLLQSLAARDPRLTPLVLESNRGIVGGRQAGLELADGEFVLFLDNDTEIERPDFLRIMVNAIRSHPNIGSTGAFPIAYTSDRDDSLIQCVHVPGLAVPVAWVSGYCLLVRRRALAEIGGLEPEAFAAYGGEDVYLGYRLREQGWITVSTSDLVGVSHHIVHGQNHYDYDWRAAGEKNRALFHRRFGPRRRLLDPARDNRIALGCWDPDRQALA